MNKEYKKGFMEAIDGVLNILKESQEEFVHEDEINLIYYTKLIEAKVLKLKISFFENYYDSPTELKIEGTEENKELLKELINRSYMIQRESKLINQEEEQLTPLQKQMQRVDSF